MFKKNKKNSASIARNVETQNTSENTQDTSLNSNKKTKKKKKKRKFGFLFGFIFKISLIAGIVYLLLLYVFSVKRMTGNSMIPAIKDGDLCIFYKLEDYYTSDIVLYKTENDDIRAGRIIAIKDQEVDFPEYGGYTINGFQPSEEILYQTYKENSSDVKYPITIEPDTYFILNDFRTDTVDSRSYGPIKKEQLLGKLIFVLRRRNF